MDEIERSRKRGDFLLLLLLILFLLVCGRAAYLDYRWRGRCEQAGGVVAAVGKCVRPGSFIEVPR